MDIKVLKEITKLMKDNDLVEVEVESGELKVKLRKAQAQVATVVQTVAAAPMAAAPVAAAPAPSAAPAKSAEEANWKPITSPIPGTVYLKPNPDAANFVAEGTAVDAGKVVCLVEAMKVFNEIKPEQGISGQIKRICVKDGQPVEYGTVLFLVG
ncbi:MAG: acetyl-CoA carboxylase biotin carboxyl carrier protein [Planctomycetes bacterium]|nr:acetyl-CoA carboxylase biotin carboxyl carrier protein [Planctomycetota bacterium]